jgi:DNA-directed RNA polymerase specialized sigma24 family protein
MKNSVATSRADVNDVIRAHHGWARARAFFYSRKYRIDFEDLYAFALEAIWKAFRFAEREGDSVDVSSTGALILKRIIIDEMRKRIARGKLSVTSEDFDLVSSCNVILTRNLRRSRKKESLPKSVDPCVICGTPGGYTRHGRTRPARNHGMCYKCYHRDRYMKLQGIV